MHLKIHNLHRNPVCSLCTLQHTFTLLIAVCCAGGLSSSHTPGITEAFCAVFVLSQAKLWVLDRKYCSCSFQCSDLIYSSVSVQKHLADTNTNIQIATACSQMIKYNKYIIHLQYHGPLNPTDSPTTQNCGPNSMLLKDLIWDEYLYTARYFTLNKNFFQKYK